MKKQSITKLAALAMAAAMSATAVISNVTPIIAYAQTSSAESSTAQQAAMKTALTKVKKRVSIPAELTEFTYSTDNSFGLTKFDFKWTTPKDSQASKSLNISIVGNVIIQYSYNDYDKSYSNTQSFAKLSDAQIVTKAKDYMKMLNPDIYDDGSYTISSISLFGDTATINFQRKVNGVAVDENGASISINKDTGELYSCYASWWEDAAFSAATNVLSSDDAKAAFKKLCTLTPAYTIQYDWETEEYKAILVYRPDFTDEIDAYTGKKSTIWDDMQNDKGISYDPFGYYINDLTSGEGCEEEAVAEEDVGFTEAELKEIQADESLLKKDKITELLQNDKYIKLDKDFKISRATLTKLEDTEDYFYEMRYHNDGKETKNADGTTDVDLTKEGNLYIYLNAKTGAVESFNYNYNYLFNNCDDTKAYPVKKNGTVAENVIKYFYPEIYGEYRAAESNSIAADYWMDKTTKVKHYETSRVYTFNRYVNNVIVEGDVINVNITSNGDVASISYNYTDVKFPSAPEFDKDQAFAQLFKQQTLNKYYDGYYKKDGSVKTYMVYKTASFTLDRNYKLVTYNGYDIDKAEKENTDYTDISGIKQEKAIKAMARYGITLSSQNGVFNPKGTLTDEEFTALVRKVLYNYSYAKITEDDNNVLLTNKLAAKIFVEQMNGSEFAQLKGIYKSPFTDVAATDEYVGYIAIAKAMGFMTGSDGKFNSNHKITRAEAMQIVYDYILYLNK